MYPPAGASQAPVVALQVWPTGHDDVLTHTPLLQQSPPVQATPSLHGAVLFWKTQPVAALHESSVQGLPSLHTRDVPGVQVPAWQVSTPLHALPSLQLEPLGALDVCRAGGARAGAGFRDVAGARREPAHGAGAGERVRRAGGAGSGAGLRHVADTRRRTAQRTGCGEDVGRARRAGARTGLGHVAEARGGTADRAGAGELAPAGAARAAVARLTRIDLPVAALSRGRDDDA